MVYRVKWHRLDLNSVNCPPTSKTTADCIQLPTKKRSLLAPSCFPYVVKFYSFLKHVNDVWLDEMFTKFRDNVYRMQSELGVVTLA